jgi:hypothetical protein
MKIFNCQPNVIGWLELYSAHVPRTRGVPVRGDVRILVFDRASQSLDKSIPQRPDVHEKYAADLIHHSWEQRAGYMRHLPFGITGKLSQYDGRLPHPPHRRHLFSCLFPVTACQAAFGTAAASARASTCWHEKRRERGGP